MLILWKNTLDNTDFREFCTFELTTFAQLFHSEKIFFRRKTYEKPTAFYKQKRY